MRATKKRKDLLFLMNQQYLSLKAKEVEENRTVVKIVIDVIKLISKQSLAFRAHGTNESLYNLKNPSLNHGNFLEIIKMFALHNPTLSNHLDRAIKRSLERIEQQKATGKKTQRRGSLVTFLSKTFVNKVIDIILKLIRSMILKEIGRATIVLS